jgi:pimeloyl-ACP methyl ester carboxylesterase
MATFVLVHGAIVGGWCWRWVAPHLRAAGHAVCTPTLTGLGERVHLASPQVDLDMHIADVVNVLRYEDLTGVVLVGWSYGGMIVAGAADRAPERIAHLVYLDSDVPRDGETSSPLSSHARLEELARIHDDGWRVPPAVTRAVSLLRRALRAAPTQNLDAADPSDRRCRRDPDDLRSLYGRLRPCRRGHPTPGRSDPQRTGLALSGTG